MSVTIYEIAQRFVGVRELPGEKDNPFIMAMLTLDSSWPDHDEVAWCSAFVNFVAWLLRLPRSKSLRARSWMDVGMAVPLHKARLGDVVVLSRPDAGPAAGHVGFFAGHDASALSSGVVYLLGGNQSNAVTVAGYSASKVLGVRRLDP